MDFSNYKFRCSSLGALMANQPGKKDTKDISELSESAKAECIKVYVKEVYGREKDISSKYLEKGNTVEEDSITLLSRIKKTYFVKNTVRKENDYITGEADIVDPDLYDTKSCWDIHSFFKAKTSKLVSGYCWQMKGYCELYGFEKGIVAFTLIDTPLGLIESEKRSLFYKMDVATMENPLYLEACASLEKELTFSDIPMEERIHEVAVPHCPEDMQKLYERIIICRQFLSEFTLKELTI